MPKLTQEQVNDTSRDTLALIAAVYSGNEEAVQVILDNADLRVMSVLLAGAVRECLELAGVDPAEYIAECHRHQLGITGD